MAELLDIDGEEILKDKDELTEHVMNKKWQLAQTYSIGNSNASVEDKMPVWYIIDEFAARIQHSDKPNFRMVPFISLLDNCAYSLLFPIRYINTFIAFVGSILKFYPVIITLPKYPY